MACFCTFTGLGFVYLHTDPAFIIRIRIRNTELYTSRALDPNALSTWPSLDGAPTINSLTLMDAIVLLICMSSGRWVSQMWWTVARSLAGSPFTRSSSG